MTGGVGASRMKTEICTFIFYFYYRRVVHAHIFGSLKKIKLNASRDVKLNSRTCVHELQTGHVDIKSIKKIV